MLSRSDAVKFGKGRSWYEEEKTLDGRKAQLIPFESSLQYVNGLGAACLSSWIPPIGFDVTFAIRVAVVVAESSMSSLGHIEERESGNLTELSRRRICRLIGMSELENPFLFVRVEGTAPCDSRILNSRRTLSILNIPMYLHICIAIL